jgi:hypothetical protein
VHGSYDAANTAKRLDEAAFIELRRFPQKQQTVGCDQSTNVRVHFGKNHVLARAKTRIVYTYSNYDITFNGLQVFLACV